MKRIIKLLLLSVIVMFTAGWANWTDVILEYGQENKDVTNINCTYNFSGENVSHYQVNGKNIGMSTLRIKADNKNFWVNFNSSESSTAVVSSEEFNESVTYRDLTFTFTNEQISNFLDSYAENNTCPSTIFITDNLYFKTEFITNSDILTLSGNNTSKKNDCHHDSATSCKVYNKRIDNYFQSDVYIELGYYDSTKRYLAIASDEDFSDIVSIDDDESLGNFSLEVTNDKTTYTFFIYSSSKNSIWVDSSFVDYFNLTYKLVDNEIYYYINTKEDDNKTTVDDLEEKKEEESETCSSEVLDKLQIIGYIVYVIKIVVPLIIIVQGISSLTKGISLAKRQGEKVDKKVFIKFIRKVVIAIIIFMIPLILSNITINKEYNNCHNCLFNPFNGCGK